MLKVTLSEQYQIAIPQEISDSLKLQVGQKFIIRVQDNVISLISEPELASFRGILKGANTDNVRDRNDRQ